MGYSAPMRLNSVFHSPIMHAGMIAEAGFWPILGALVAQYGFGYAPCALCLLQRYPYFALFFVAFITLLRPRQSHIWLLLAAFLCLVSAAIGLFHTGVELGWWQYESGCIPEAGVADSLEDLKRSISNAPIVACDQAMLYVFGLSMAAWNAIYGTLAALGLLLACKYDAKLGRNNG